MTPSARVSAWGRRHSVGLALAVALAVVARLTAAVLPIPISEVTIGLALGLLVRNTIALPSATLPGVRFATSSLLRIGIVLLGVRLAFGDVVDTGIGALLLIVICMAFALAFVLGLGHLLGLPPRLSVLIAVGTAVCGNSAIVATAPVIDAEERDVSFAVATITLFGTLAVLIYPLLGGILDLSDRFFGHWAGVAVNDMGQVTATGFAFSEGAGAIATIVKLTRNTFMAPLIVLIGAIYLRSGARAQEPTERSTRGTALRAVPAFVIAFVAVAVVNSLGLIPEAVADGASYASTGLILIALVAVGLGTDIGAMRKVGVGPFILGLVAAFALSVLAIGLTALLIGA